MGDKDKSKKEQILERNKKTQIIQHAIKEHKENRDSAYVSHAGYAKVEPMEGESTYWRDKVTSMRAGLSKGRERSRKRARALFK